MQFTISSACACSRVWSDKSHGATEKWTHKPVCCTRRHDELILAFRLTPVRRASKWAFMLESNCSSRARQAWCSERLHVESQHLRNRAGSNRFKHLGSVYISDQMWGSPTSSMFGCYVPSRSRLDSAPCCAWGDWVGGVTQGRCTIPVMSLLRADTAWFVLGLIVKTVNVYTDNNMLGSRRKLILCHCLNDVVTDNWHQRE